jgi:ABC-type phosphate transport system permease subunit
MNCTRCQTLNPVGATSCMSCGAPLGGQTPYRNDWGAAVARAQSLENELRLAQQAQHQDAQRIAQLTQQLDAARAELARLQAQMGAMAPGAGFAYQSYAYASRGTTILVLGVLSIMLCQILGPIAWSMGSEELKRIDSNQTSPEERSSAQAGYICGIISTVLLILTVLVIVVAIGAVAASGNTR